MRRGADSKEKEKEEEEEEEKEEKKEVKEEKNSRLIVHIYCQTYIQQDNCLCYCNIAQCHTAHVKSDM